MSTKTTTQGDLEPIQWEAIFCLPVPDVIELPPLVGWERWDEAMRQLDEIASRQAQR